MLASKFDENDIGVIELEPVLDTATQIIYEQDLKNKAYGMGIERGYKEGSSDGRCREKCSRYPLCHC